MQPYQRRAVAALLADHQRDMFPKVVRRAEGDDLGLFAGCNRQPRARGKLEAHRIAPFGKIAGRHRLNLAHRCEIDEEGRQHARQPRQFHRRARGLAMLDMLGKERALHRIHQVERRIGQRAGQFEVERLRGADQDRGIGLCRLALVGELERCRACGRNQHARGGCAGAEAGLGG